MGQRWAFAQIRLVGKKVAVKDSRITCGTIIRTLTKNMVGVTAIYTTRKAKRVCALKIGSGVDRKARRCIGRRWLVASHFVSSAGDINKQAKLGTSYKNG